jgi:hypothetical protein
VDLLCERSVTVVVCQCNQRNHRHVKDVTKRCLSMFMCVAWRLTVDSRLVFCQVTLEHVTVVFRSVKVDYGVKDSGTSSVIDMQEVVYHRVRYGVKPGVRHF